MTNTIMHGIPQVLCADCAFISISVTSSNLTEFDMNILQERLKEQKRMREKAALNKTPPSRRKEQYTPVEIDTGTDEVKLADSATTDSESSGEGAFRRHPQCKKPPPTSMKPRQSPSSSASENETTPKRKALPPTPAKKPIEPPKPKPTVKREDASRVPPTQAQSLVDRMNQPLPPTPAEESPISSSGGRSKASAATSTTGSALLKEIKAKQGKNSSTGDGEKRSKKKQPIPIPTQRLPNDSSKPLAALTTEQLHEPAGYANLPVHDAPYQNMGFGPDATEEPDVLYENTTRIQKPKGNRLSPSGAQPPHKGYSNARINGKEVSNTGSEYQNVNARRQKIRESPQKY